MNKEELINIIAEKTSATKSDCAKHLTAFLEAAQESLVKGEMIQLIGFGSFAVADSAERQGRNPQTGKVITIPASKRVKFSAGKALKEAVNNAKSKKPAAKNKKKK